LLIHPTRLSASELDEKVFTARDFQRHADRLEECDQEIIDLMSARTGYVPWFFEAQMEDAEYLTVSDALDSGIVHEMDGLTPRCSLEWVNAAQMLAKQGAVIERR
jgi:ATP-dependent protease ClpP protease subunit